MNEEIQRKIPVEQTHMFPIYDQSNINNLINLQNHINHINLTREFGGNLQGIV
jgi:hypothetical protein